MLPNGCVGTIVPSKSVKGTVYTGITICRFVVCLYACVCVFAGRLVKRCWQTEDRDSQRCEWRSVDTNKGRNVYEVAR